MSRQARIENQLKEALKPLYMEVNNESYKHHVPEGSETHFKLIIVSQSFEDKSLINRHKMLNALLKAELEEGLHALSLSLHTEKEWIKAKETITGSPNCRDGFGR